MPPILFLEAPRDVCRWPLWGGDESVREKFVCGETMEVSGRPYCAHHAGINRDANGFRRAIKPNLKAA